MTCDNALQPRILSESLKLRGVSLTPCFNHQIGCRSQRSSLQKLGDIAPRYNAVRTDRTLFYSLLSIDFAIRWLYEAFHQYRVYTFAVNDWVVKAICSFYGIVTMGYNEGSTS